MKNTQCTRIHQHMMDNPDRWFLSSDFCGRDPEAPFIGYESPTRLGDLQRKGIVESRWSNRENSSGRPLKEYKLKGLPFDDISDSMFL